MINWHEYKKEHPPKNGDYLVVTFLDDDGEARYGNITVMRFYKRNTLIPYISPDHYFPNGTQNESVENMTRILSCPDYWTAAEGWYEEECRCDEQRLHYPLRDTEHLFWAYLPHLPDGYIGNQNDYLTAWFISLPEAK